MLPLHPAPSPAIALLTLLLLLPFSAAAASSNDLGRPVWSSNGLSALLDPGLGEHLPSVGVEFTALWRAGSLPEDCKKVAEDGGICKLEDVEVFDAVFDDCSTSWTFCRCKTAQMSKADLRDTFRKIPVGLRSTVKHIMAFPDANAHAYAQNGNIVFFGDCGDTSRPSTMIHEAAHTMDRDSWSVKNLVDPMKMDRCVPDSYANTAIWEDYAQLMVVHLANLIIPGLPKPASCMRNQLQLFNRYIPAARLWAAECDLSVKPLPSAPVKLTNGTVTFTPAAVDNTSSASTGSDISITTADASDSNENVFDDEPVNIIPPSKNTLARREAERFAGERRVRGRGGYF